VFFRVVLEVWVLKERIFVCVFFYCVTFICKIIRGNSNTKSFFFLRSVFLRGLFLVLCVPLCVCAVVCVPCALRSVSFTNPPPSQIKKGLLLSCRVALCRVVSFNKNKPFLFLWGNNPRQGSYLCSSQKIIFFTSLRVSKKLQFFHFVAKYFKKQKNEKSKIDNNTIKQGKIK